jgi:hypothetical protein
MNKHDPSASHRTQHFVVLVEYPKMGREHVKRSTEYLESDDVEIDALEAILTFLFGSL